MSAKRERGRGWGGPRQTGPADLRVQVRCGRCGVVFFEAAPLRYRQLTVARATARAQAAVHAQTTGHDTPLRASLFRIMATGYDAYLPRACTRWSATIPYVNPREAAAGGADERTEPGHVTA
jgi:hypothetical protein